MKKLNILIALLIISILIITACKKEEKSFSAGELFDVIHSAVTFPVTDIITDADMINEYTGLEVSDDMDYMFAWQVFSIDLAEIFVAVSADKKTTDELFLNSNTRLSQLKESGDLYPEQQEAVNNAVCGKKGNIVYLICHKDASTAEKALIEYIS